MTLDAYGRDAPFQPADLPHPTLKPGHVLVRVAATSVNTVDTMIRASGKELPLAPDLPAVLGMVFAGAIEAVGEGVTGFERCVGGGHADRPLRPHRWGR